MSNTELANFGLFMASMLGFGIGTLIIGGGITNFDTDDMFIGAWLIGTFVFAFAILIAYGR